MQTAITVTYEITPEEAAELLADTNADGRILAWVRAHPERIVDREHYYNVPNLRAELGAHLTDEALGKHHAKP